MADVINLQDHREGVEKSSSESCSMLYQALNFDPSNVVFAPIFCSSAQKAYANFTPEVKEAS